MPPATRDRLTRCLSLIEAVLARLRVCGQDADDLGSVAAELRAALGHGDDAREAARVAGLRRDSDSLVRSLAIAGLRDWPRQMTDPNFEADLPEDRSC